MIGKPAALEVSNLRVCYGDTEVLHDVDVTIDPGEIYGLLGPNGAGKTTLIRTICGRVRPARGRIRIAGRETGAEMFRQIGLVPQEIALYPHLTIRENLQVFGRLAGLSSRETETAIDDVSEAANLRARMSDRVDILSGGWKRRANIAAAILHLPALLILDEPMVGVDLEARNGLQSVIQKLSGLGMGILLVTHDLYQAEILCTKVGLMHDGTISPQGYPRELLEEAFQDKGEILLEFGTSPSAAHQHLLRQLGFTPNGGPLSWSLIGDRSPSDLAADLVRASLAPKEVRYRKPNLETLFMRHSQRIGMTMGEDAA